MTDFPISPPQSASFAEKFVTAFTRLIAQFRTAQDALAQATARNAESKATRRAPEEILAAQARREEARRAVDRLWLGR